MRFNYAQISQNIPVRKQARENEKQRVSSHPDSQISIDSQSWNEIRTVLKKFKGLGQGRNLIKMEIRPRDMRYAFVAHIQSTGLNLAQWSLCRQTFFFFYLGMLDFVFFLYKLYW